MPILVKNLGLSSVNLMIITPPPSSPKETEEFELRDVENCEKKAKEKKNYE